MTNALKQQIETKLQQELAALNMADISIVPGLESCPDDTDYATQLTQHELNLTMMRRAAQGIRDIEMALERLNSPEYGECHECGEHIGDARLLANPLATHCVSCQEKRENGLCA